MRQHLAPGSAQRHAAGGRSAIPPFGGVALPERPAAQARASRGAGLPLLILLLLALGIAGGYFFRERIHRRMAEDRSDL